MNHKITLAIFTFCVVYCNSMNTLADIYRYVDEDGTVLLTNLPELRTGYKIKIGPFNSYSTATSVSNKLSESGIDAFTLHKITKDLSVYIGNYKTKEMAKSEANKLVNKKIINKYEITVPVTNKSNNNNQKYDWDYMQEYLNSKQFRTYFERSLTESVIASEEFQNIPVKEYFAECKTGYQSIACTLFFPVKWKLGEVPQRYQNFMYSMTSRVAYIFSKKYKVRFVILGVYGNFPFCNTWYDYYSDQFGSY